MRQIVKGSTDQSVVIRIVDATDGTPEEAVEHNSPGISLWYRREGGLVVAITPAALAAANSAHADGGIEHLDDGYYRIDLPDAAVASGADGVTVGGTVSGMVVIGCYVPLRDAVLDANVAQISGDSTAADNLETMLDGTGGQTLSLRSIEISNSSGNALEIHTADGHGIEIIAGNGNDGIHILGAGGGDGIMVQGGATGHGIHAVGGSTSGDAVRLDVTSGVDLDAANIVAAIAAVQSTANAVETDTQDIQSRLPAALVSGRIAADAIAISGSTAAADAVEANIGNLDAAVSSRLATAGYTAPDNASIAAILVDTGTTLPATLADMAGATFDTSTDSLEALRNRGDAAWTTATGFSTLDAAGVRAAVGLAAANLDTQLAALASALADIFADTGTDLPASLATIAGYIDTEIAAIKAKTDNLPASPAAVGDIPTASANAAAVLASTIETGKTLVQALQIIAAAVAGNTNGTAGQNPEVFKGIDGSTTRLSVANDATGNRTATYSV